MISMRATNKPFHIDKRLVYEAYKAVKSNRGAAGVDEQTIEQFEADLSENLYKIWNRMSSGSYFPPPVRAVSIPKKSGGERILGVPTVADRVAQMVVKQVIELILDSIFLADSYGYRPNKSALDAVGVTRERCWKYDWVLEFDIKGLFDNIDHDLLLRAVRKHVTGCCCTSKDGSRRPWCRRMGPLLREAAARLRAGWSAQSWPTSLCTTRSMSGWYGRTLVSRGVGMQMMDWCTVVTSKRHRRLSLSFKLVWRSAVLRCIRRKPKSFTVKTENGKASIRMSNLTFSGSASDHVWSKISETRHCSGASIRRLVPRR
jgi:hypothetical protein